MFNFTRTALLFLLLSVILCGLSCGEASPDPSPLAPTKPLPIPSQALSKLPPPESVETSVSYAPRPPGTITFNKDIAPIIFEHCSICHRSGEAAPFEFLSYHDVKKRARQILDVTESRFMPPWKPVPGYGVFLGDRSLSTTELGLVRQWVEEGSKEGDPVDLTPPPEFPTDWQLGEPDRIVSMPEEYILPPGGTDIFRSFIIPTDESTLRYVRAVEFRPSNRKVVHHANLRVDTGDTARRLDAQSADPGFEEMWVEEASSTGHLVGWHPGRAPVLNPPGVSWPLAKGSDLLLSVHMLPTGKFEKVHFTLGLHFADRPPTRHSLLLRLASKTMNIPPGVKDYRIEDSFTLPVDLTIFSLRPHAHYLGKDIGGFATLPDGTTRWLIRIDDWDFNWQDEYRPKTPMFLPQGTTITMQCTYDNSTDNVRNPHDPPRRVRWGPKTQDEMGVLFIQALVDDPSDAAMVIDQMNEHQEDLVLAHWSQRVVDDPANANLRVNYAYELQLRGRVKEAIEQGREALEIEPTNANAHNSLGANLAASGAALSESVHHFREAIRHDPKHADALDNLAGALIVQGEVKEAISHFRAVVGLKEDHPSSHLRLAEALALVGEREDAIVHYRETLRLQPRIVEARFGLARALRLDGKPEEAIENFRQAIDDRPWVASWHRELGTALVEAGQSGDAILSFERAARLKPEWPQPIKKIAWILATHPDESVRDPIRAVELADRAISLSKKKNPSLLDTLAAAYACAGRFDEAAKVADQGLELEYKANGASEQGNAIRDRRELYLNKIPYREPKASSSR